MFKEVIFLMWVLFVFGGKLMGIASVGCFILIG